MKNPLRGWYSDLFGSRGVDVALLSNTSTSWPAPAVIQ
jgi:hypothetical protein